MSCCQSDTDRYYDIMAATVYVDGHDIYRGTEETLKAVRRFLYTRRAVPKRASYKIPPGSKLRTTCKVHGCIRLSHLVCVNDEEEANLRAPEIYESILAGNFKTLIKVFCKKWSYKGFFNARKKCKEMFGV